METAKTVETATTAETKEAQQESPSPVSDGEKYDELAYAVGKLLAAIRNVHQSKEYQHVWQLYSAHQFIYRGPDYERELSNVIDVLWKHRRGLDGTHS